MRAALPREFAVRTGSEEAAKQTSELEENLGFLRTFLLVFAYVALVVGAFIIFNTFSITVAQRTREFGLLRTLGASRGQIMRSVIAEGLLLGLIGALIGLSPASRWPPPSTGCSRRSAPTCRTTARCSSRARSSSRCCVGILVTVLAGLFPAVRATRVPPLAAMREGVPIPRYQPSRRALVVRFLISLVLVIVLDVVTGSHVLLPHC